MCVVSNVGDFYQRRWNEYYPVPVTSPPTQVTIYGGVSREEFEALKREVEECKRLLKMAKDIDKSLGNPDCEMDEKVAIIRKMADLVGVDLEGLLGED